MEIVSPGQEIRLPEAMPDPRMLPFGQAKNTVVELKILNLKHVFSPMITPSPGMGIMESLMVPPPKYFYPGSSRGQTSYPLPPALSPSLSLCMDSTVSNGGGGSRDWGLSSMWRTWDVALCGSSRDYTAPFPLRLRNINDVELYQNALRPRLKDKKRPTIAKYERRRSSRKSARSVYRQSDERKRRRGGGGQDWQGVIKDQVGPIRSPTNLLPNPLLTLLPIMPVEREDNLTTTNLVHRRIPLSHEPLNSTL